jgi:hypothetical protein
MLQALEAGKALKIPPRTRNQPQKSLQGPYRHLLYTRPISLPPYLRVCHRRKKRFSMVKDSSPRLKIFLLLYGPAEYSIRQDSVLRYPRCLYLRNRQAKATMSG